MSAQPLQYAIVHPGLGAGASVALSAAEYSELVVAKKILFEILSLEEKWEMVVANHLDLEKTLNEIAAEHMIQGESDYDRMNDRRLTINRRVMNILAATRLYLDHAPQHLRHLEMEVLDLAQIFTKQTNRHFDESRAYRIADMMRNHAQHAGFPIDGIRLDISNAERANAAGVLLYRIEAYLDLNALIANKANRAATREELKGLDEPQSVRQVLREYVARLSLIHQVVRKAIETMATAKEALLGGAIQRFEERYSNLVDFPLSIVEFEDDGTWKTDTAIFKKFLERRTRMVARNRALPHLIRAHVSTEPDVK